MPRQLKNRLGVIKLFQRKMKKLPKQPPLKRNRLEGPRREAITRRETHQIVIKQERGKGRKEIFQAAVCYSTNH